MEKRKPSGGIKYTPAFESRWRAFRERVAVTVRRNPSLSAAAKVIIWEIIDRANKVDGRAHASSRGLGFSTRMSKNTINTALHLLHEQRVIDLENSETEGGAHNRATAYLLLDGKRWPGPGSDDIKVSQEMGQVAKAVVSQKLGHPIPKTGTGGVPHSRDTRTHLREPIKNLPSADALAPLADGSLARPGPVIIPIGSEQWRAWLSHHETHNPTRARLMRDLAENGKGWSERSEWPPDVISLHNSPPTAPAP
jgi:hypothetical protein